MGAAESFAVTAGAEVGHWIGGQPHAGSSDHSKRSQPSISRNSRTFP